MRPARTSWLAAALLAAAAPSLPQPGANVGKQLFVKDATPPCALCHTLADAGATANIGPSLDELRPDAARVVQAVKNGIGAMPPYKQLSDEQVQTLAQYVAKASGGAK